MSIIKRADIYQVVLYAAFSRLSLFLISAIAAYYLTASEYGIFSYVLVGVSGIAALSSMGIGVTCNTVTASWRCDDPERMVSSIVWVFLLSASLVLALSAVFIAFASRDVFIFNGWAVYAYLSVCCLLMILYGGAEGILYGADGLKDMAFYSIIFFPLVIVGSLLMMAIFGFLGAIFSIIFLRFMNLSWILTLASKLWPRVPIRPALKTKARMARDDIAKIALPIGGAAMLSGPLASLSIFIMERNVGMEGVASFAFVYQYYVLSVFLPGVIGNVLISRFSSKRDRGKKVFIISLGAVVFYSFFVFSGFFLLSLLSSYLAPNIKFENGVAFFLALAAVFYCGSAVFHSYWAANQKGVFVLGAQATFSCFVLWGAIIAKNVDMVAMSFFVGAIGQYLANSYLWVKWRRRCDLAT
ncbi:hypothetical protein ACRYJU_06735 [Alloalcanivorax xenomutans]|uniref:hypothetical protein n=1 Tax=Alloalcanivorax xenomutans TaxID=1094342 RepID=UPI003D9BC6B8